MKQTILLSGYYEHKHRNPLIGALLLVVIVGALYFTIGGIVSQVTLTISKGVQVFKTRSPTELARKKLSTPDATIQTDTDAQTEQQDEQNTKPLFEYDISALKYPTLILTTIFQFCIMLPLTLKLGKIWFTQTIDVYMGYRNFSFTGIMAGALLGIAIIPLASFIGDYLYNFFPGIKKLTELSGGMLTASSKADLLFIIVAIGVTPAVCEEALFRGIFLRTLSRKFPAWLAIFASSLLFTLFHSSILSLPSIFIAGLSLGFAYWAFESIYASMAVHFCYNTGLVLVTNNVWNSATYMTAEDGSIKLPVLGFSFLLITIIVLFMYAERKTVSSRSEQFAKAIE